MATPVCVFWHVWAVVHDGKIKSWRSLQSHLSSSYRGFGVASRQGRQEYRRRTSEVTPIQALRRGTVDGPIEEHHLDMESDGRARAAFTLIGSLHGRPPAMPPLPCRSRPLPTTPPPPALNSYAAIAPSPQKMDETEAHDAREDGAETDAPCPLEVMFFAMEQVLPLFHRRRQAALWKSVRAAVEGMCRRSFTRQHLAQIMYVQPGEALYGTVYVVQSVHGQAYLCALVSPVSCSAPSSCIVSCARRQWRNQHALLL